MPASPLSILVFDKSEFHLEVLKNELDKAGLDANVTLTKSTGELINRLQEHDFEYIVLFDSDASLSIPDLKEKSLNKRDNNIILVVTEKYHRENALQLVTEGAHNVYSQDELANLVQEMQRISSIIKKTELVNEQRQSIRKSQERFQTLINNIPSPVAYTHQGGFVNINPAFARLFKLTNAEEVAEISLLDLIDDADKGKVKTLLNRLEKSEKIKSDALNKVCIINGQRRPQETDLLFHKTNLNGEDCIQVIVKTESDFEKTAVIQNKPQSQNLSPEFLIQKLNQAIRQKSSEYYTALSLVETADYSRIKKNLGITRAERIMQQVHDLIMSFNDDSVLVSQTGTDIYCLLVKKASKDECVKTLEEIRKTFEKHLFNLDEYSIQMPLNIGLVHLTENITSPDQAFSLADVACTVARNRNDNAIHIYNPEQDRSTVETLDENWTSRIRDAIQNNNFKLVFQPIIALKNPGIANYEVLLRMKSSTGSDILPNQFLHAAKQSQFEIDIDQWVITNTLTTLNATNQTDTSVFIKLSESSLRSLEFFNWLQKLDIAYKKHIVFEISEELAIQWPSEILNLLQERQHSGFKICIEQFGNHPEAEEELFELHADYYKIDGAFSNHLATNRKHQSIIHKISLNSKGRDIRTIACFVQDADSLAILWQEGFDFIQGNYLQAPKTELDYQFESLI